MIELYSYSLSAPEFLALILAATLVGMSKTGVQGVAMISMPVLAIVFGGKASTGILLPMLIFADVFAVHYYHQHANWHHLRRLLPYAMVGIVIGTIVGDFIDDRLFEVSMAVITFFCVAIMIWQQNSAETSIPTSHWFVVGIGIIGGFTTMVGNLSGPVMALYLLAMQFPKNQFIGTAAWFFLVVNIAKLPLHICVWQTVNINSFLLDLSMLPAIAIGAWLGVRIARKIPEKNYRWFVIIMTSLAAAVMLI